MEDLECEKCNFKFTQKSSLKRHSQRCMQRRPQGARQKSCKECAVAKVRCDLKRPKCSRCMVRKTSCKYASELETRDSSGTENETSHTVNISWDGNKDLGSIEYVQQQPDSAQSTARVFPPTVYDGLDPNLTTFFSSPNDASDGSESPNWLFRKLVPTSNSELLDLMGTDLLNPPPSLATTPTRVQHSMELVFRQLRTWPRKMAKDIDLPPIIHPSQVVNKSKPMPLLNCFTLTKMWYGQRPGACDFVQNTVKKEMQEIMDNYKTMDEITLLSALQALAIYTIMLLFPNEEQTSLPLLEDDMFRQIRQIVYHCATPGLTLEEETMNVRPTWESWIHMTTKRRAVLSLYLIQWSYSIYHCSPSYDCKDLNYIPAPSPKYLWQASDQKTWESLYNRWLAQWDGDLFFQGELGDIKPGLRMTLRAEKWLEDADEFGMVFFSLVNAWEREPEFEVVHL